MVQAKNISMNNSDNSNRENNGTATDHPNPLLRFLWLLIKCRKFRMAWHGAFHRDHEQWSLIQFRDGTDQFYHSKHEITCRCCRIRYTTRRVWPKFNADLNSGFQLSEAHQKASVYSARP